MLRRFWRWLTTPRPIPPEYDMSHIPGVPRDKRDWFRPSMNMPYKGMVVATKPWPTSPPPPKASRPRTLPEPTQPPAPSCWKREVS